MISGGIEVNFAEIHLIEAQFGDNPKETLKLFSEVF